MKTKEDIENVKQTLLLKLPLLALFGLALLYVLSSNQTRRHLLDAPKEEFELLSSAVEKKIKNELSEAATQMENLAEIGTLKDVVISTEVAKQVLEKAEGFSAVSIYDTFGTLLATTQESPLDVVPYSGLFESVLRSKSVVSRPIIVDEDSQGEVMVLVPVLDDFEQPIMILVGMLPMGDMWSEIGESLAGEETSVALLDAFGRVMARPDDELLSDLTKSADDGDAKINLSKEEHIFENGYYYVTRELRKKSGMGGPDWTVLYLRPYTTVVNLVSKSTLISLGMSMVTIALVGMVGWTVMRRIQEPLQRTSVAANKLAKGQLDVNLPREGPTELKSIAAAINHMSSEVRYHRHTMSTMVEARTRGLERAQKAQEMVTSQLKASYESAEEGVMVVDVITGDILQVNKRMGTLLAIPEEDLKSLTAEHFCETLKTLFYEPVDFVNRWTYYCDHPDEEGREEWQLRSPRDMTLSVYTAPVKNEEQNVIISRLWTFRDVTEHRAREVDLRQTQQLEAMSHMAGSIAHDFNNLLTVIIGNLSLARLECKEDSELFEFLECAYDATSDATGLVKQLLGFSNRTRLHLQAADINDVLGQVKDVLRRNLNTEIRIVAKLAPNLWDAPADAAQLRQALTSTAMSSVDAVSGPCDLHLISENVTLEPGGNEMPSEMTETEYVKIFVQISTERDQRGASGLERLYEPFGDSDQENRSGLGISMAYGIVKKHGGWMTTTSEKGLGKCLCIYLPKSERRSESMKIEPSVNTPDARADASVLVVDDEPGVRRVAVSLLKRRGLATLEACDGEDALRIYKENRSKIGVVLLDLSMPKLSGRETFIALKSMDEELPILVCSGYPVAAEDFEKETGYRPDGVVQKPFDVAGLASKVSAAIGSPTV